MQPISDLNGTPALAAPKICFVTEALGPGGAERVISLLASRWAAAGWDVSICTFDSPDDRVYHPVDQRVRLLRLGIHGATGDRRGLALLKRIGLLRSVLLRERPDVVLSFLTKINVLSLIATIGTGIRVAACERNNPAKQKTHKLWQTALNVLLRRADAVVVQTKRALDHIPLAVRGRASVIANPIEVPPGIPAAYDKDSDLHMVAVGRLTEQKGFDLLIEAFSRIAMKNPDWVLDIWGEGADRRVLEAMIAACPAADRIILRGVSGIQGGWAEGASLFVLPSRYEGFPNVLGEAMASGLPVTAFDCPYGPREMIHNGFDGLLVENQNVAALARALDRLMMTPWLRRSLGENAAHSSRRFTPDHIARQWETLVANVARRGTGRAQARCQLAGGTAASNLQP